MNKKQFLRMLKVAAEESQQPDPMPWNAPASKWQAGINAAIDAPVHVANRLWETGLIGNSQDLGIKAFTGANKVLGDVSEYYTGNRITPIKEYKRGLQDLVNGRNAYGRTIGAEDYARDFEMNLGYATGSDRVGRWGGNILRGIGWGYAGAQALAELYATAGLSTMTKPAIAAKVGIGGPLANAGIRALKAMGLWQPAKVTAQATKDFLTDGGRRTPESPVAQGVLRGANIVEGAANLTPVYAAGGAFGVPPIVTTTGSIVHSTTAETGVKPRILTRMFPSLSPDILGNDSPEEERKVMLDIELKPAVRSSIAQDLGLPADASAEEVKEKLPAAIAEARMNRVLPYDGFGSSPDSKVPEALNTLDANVNWATIPPAELKPYILQHYGQEAWANAQYDAMKRELQRGGLVDANMWGKLDGLSADQMTDLFGLVVRNEDRNRMGFAEGNSLMQWLRGEGNVVRGFVNASPENEAQAVAFLQKVLDMKRQGAWNPTKEASADATSALLGSLSGKSIDTVFNPVINEWSAQEQMSLNSLQGGVPENIGMHVTRGMTRRAAKDGNYAADLGVEIKNKMMQNENSELPLSTLRYIAKEIKEIGAKDWFKDMDMKHFAKLGIVFGSGANTDKSPLPGISDAEWKNIRADFMSAAKSRAWELAWEDPIKNLPALAGMFAGMNGFSGGVVDTVSNPWIFWGAAILLLGGGLLLASDDDYADDDDDNVSAAALKRQRELLAGGF